MFSKRKDRFRHIYQLRGSKECETGRRVLDHVELEEWRRRTAEHHKLEHIEPLPYSVDTLKKK